MRKSEYSTILQNDKCFVEIAVDHTYTIDSADNKRYDYVLNQTSKRRGDNYRVLHLSVKGSQSRHCINWRLLYIFRGLCYS